MQRPLMTVLRALKADPFSGTVYVFRAKRADRIKLIFSVPVLLHLFQLRLRVLARLPS
jgi:transposase